MYNHAQMLGQAMISIRTIIGGCSWCRARRHYWHRTRTRRVRHTHLGARRRSRCQRGSLSSSVLSSSLAASQRADGNLSRRCAAHSLGACRILEPRNDRRFSLASARSKTRQVGGSQLWAWPACGCCTGGWHQLSCGARTSYWLGFQPRIGGDVGSVGIRYSCQTMTQPRRFPAPWSVHSKRGTPRPAKD